MKFFFRCLLLLTMLFMICGADEPPEGETALFLHPEMRAAGIPGNQGGMNMDMITKILPLLQSLSSVMGFFNFTGTVVSDDCAGALQTWTEELKARQMWAIQMLDASGKLPSGLLQGGFTMFGAFDECISILVPPETWTTRGSKSSYNNTIQGQYCAVSLEAKLTKTVPNGTLAAGPELLALKGAAVMFLRLDICLPDACTVIDLNKALEHHLNTESLSFKPVIKNCEVDKPMSLKGAQIAAIVILSILGLILCVGSTMDIGFRMLVKYDREEIVTKYQSNSWVQGLLAFSMYTNGMKLLSTGSTADSLSAVHGIRFLSMTWVILGHCYTFITIGILGNISKVGEFAKDFALQALFNGFLSVDSFFFLSGLLLAYLTIKELRKGGKLNVKFFSMFYFHRFWRLTPSVIFIILLVFLWPLMGSGPLWTTHTEPHYSSCQKNWWVNILYVQNLVKTPEMCLGHSWYLANDMQFYIISPIILISLYLNRYIGLAVNGLFLLASLVTSGVIAQAKHVMPTILMSGLFTTEDINTFMGDIYIKPWCRIGPFCIGIFVGYFLAFKRNYRIPKLVQLVCWCLAIAFNMAVLYGVLPWNKGNLPSTEVGHTYLSTHRTVWAMGLGWMTFACATGNGGIINRILSWKPFIPLGRLTYIAYLIHPYIQYTYTATLRERIIYTHYLYVVLFLGLLVVSYGIAFPLSLAFEAPFIALEKVIFKRESGEQKRTSVTFKANMDKELTGVVNGTGRDNHAFKPEKLTEL